MIKLKLTDNALNHLENIVKENNKKYVRLDIVCGGCAGFEYKWSFEDTIGEHDELIENVLLIDNIHELALFDMELDFKKDIFGSEFVFNNPNAKSSCGCGTSFSL